MTNNAQGDFVLIMWLAKVRRPESLTKKAK